MRLLGLFAILSLVAGCASTTVVTDAQGHEAINTVGMTCKKPYELSRDCSIWSGATRKIDIEGFELKIAGSEAGTEVLVMDAHLFKNSMSDIFTLNSPTHSQASNQSYNSVKKVLTAENISIKKAVPLRSFGNVDGYVLELDGDGYKKLIEYSVE